MRHDATRRGMMIGAAAMLLPLAARADNNTLGTIIDILGQTTGTGAPIGAGLSNSDIVSGLKAALNAGTKAAVAQVGRRDGFWGDSLIRIPLPGFLKNAQSALALVGQSGLLDDIELRLNRGAEKAAPYAKTIFINSIKSMTIDDALGILRGGDTSATDYFQRTMTPPLQTAFRPIINRELKGAGAMKSYDRMAARYSTLPFVPGLAQDGKDQLIDHGLAGALGGLFHYVGEEEKKIRHDPAKRTTEILRKVFGS